MVDLTLTDELVQIEASVADYLQSELPIERLVGRGGPIDTPDHRQWPAMAQLGWFGLGLAESEGGVGYSAVEEAILFRQLGRHLVSPSTIAATVAALVATIAGDAALAARIVSGEIRPALCIATGPADVGATSTGRIQIFDGAGAALLLLLSPSHAALVDRAAVPSIRPTRSADESIAVELADLDGVAALAHVESGAPYRRAMLLASAMLAGICDMTCTISSDYAKLRHTFGNPIGKYQAIKHKCADMAIRAASVSALVEFASVTVRDERPDADFQVTAAKLLAAQYALLNAKEAIQVHGAIGFTVELPVHLFLKRAHLLDHFAGSTRQQQMALLSQNAPQ